MNNVVTLGAHVRGLRLQRNSSMLVLNLPKKRKMTEKEAEAKSTKKYTDSDYSLEEVYVIRVKRIESVISLFLNEKPDGAQTT